MHLTILSTLLFVLLLLMSESCGQSEQFMLAVTIPNCPCPSNGCLRYSNRQAMQPIIHISVLLFIYIFQGSIISGALQISVECVYIYYFNLLFSFFSIAFTFIGPSLQLPKSHIWQLIFPEFSILHNTFYSFKSRCKQFKLCTSFIVIISCVSASFTYYDANLRFLSSSNKLISQNSVTMNPVLEYLSFSLLWLLTILLPSYFTIPAIADSFYSHIAYFLYIYSNYLFCSFIYFVAYSFPFWMSLHFHTSPYAPFAIFYCNTKVLLPI